MGFASKVIPLVQPGSTGVQTYNLPVDFDVRALILVACVLASDGDTTSSDVAAICIGAGTDEPRALTQWYFSLSAQSGDQTEPHYANGNESTDICKLYGPNLDTDPPDIDLEIQFTGFSTQIGSTFRDQFSLNWQNLYTTSSIVVFAIAFGGSDITDAHAGLRLGTVGGSPGSTQDIDTGPGFGHPDLIMFVADNAVAGDHGGTNGDADACLSVGWANAAQEQMASTFRSDDNNATVTMDYAQIACAIVGTNGSGTIATQGVLDDPANWPVGDFMRIIWQDSDGGMSDRIGTLLFKGTFQSKIGTLTNPITGGTPVAQNTNVGFPPAFAMIWGGVLPSSVSADTTSADLATFHIGFTDGAQEGNVSWSDDDGNANCRARASLSQTKTIRMQTNSGGTLNVLAEADVVFSGNDIAQSWTTIDGTAREQCYVAIGEPVAAITDEAPLRQGISPLRWR